MNDKIKRLTDAINRLWRDPFRVPFILLMGGWGMLAGSFAFSIAFVTINGKEVGYVAALNWSLNYCFIIPLIAFLTICLVHSLDRTVAFISERMIVLHTTKRPPTIEGKTRVCSYWRSLQSTSAVLWCICIPIALSLSLAEDWYRSVYIPMYELEKSVDEYNKEFPNSPIEQDWSTAALYPNNNATKLGCAIFSLLACVMQVAPVMVALWLLLTVASFGIFLIRLAYSHPEFLLVPDIGSKDVRRGFEVFESAGILAFIIVLLIYLMAWLTVLQNAYLSSQVDAANVLAFIAEPNSLPRTHSLLSYLPPIEILFLNFSIAWALICVILILSTTLLCVPIAALSLSACQARRNMLEIVQQLQDDQLRAEFSLDRIAITAALERMKYWPFRYVSLNTLMISVIVLLMAIVWFRISIFLATFIMAYALIRAKKSIRDFFSS